jgi:hypothetical protein
MARQSIYLTPALPSFYLLRLVQMGDMSLLQMKINI